MRNINILIELSLSSNTRSAISDKLLLVPRLEPGNEEKRGQTNIAFENCDKNSWQARRKAGSVKKSSRGLFAFTAPALRALVRLAAEASLFRNGLESFGIPHLSQSAMNKMP